jgi:hypothetical protein
MQRPRRAGLVRSVLVAALLLGGGVGLAACQASPGVAAYVGDMRLTDSEVDSQVATVAADLNKSDASAASSLRYGSVRQTVVELSVFNEIARRYAQEQNVTVPAPDLAGTASRFGLPADDPYVKLIANFSAYDTTLLGKAPTANPSESDLQDVYSRLVASGFTGAYADVKSQIAALPALQTGLGLRDELSQAMQRYGVGVSPRYSPPLQVPLASVSTQSGAIGIVPLFLGSTTGTPAAKDAPTQAATAPPTAAGD